MLGYNTKQTSWGAGLAEQSRGMTRFTLRKYLTLIAEQMTMKLLGGKGYKFRFDTDDLVRGEEKARAEYYYKALGGNAFMTQEEVRVKEGLPPVPEMGSIPKTSEGVPAAEEKESDDENQSRL